MNFALPALILVLIFIPGPIFVYTFKGSLRNPKAPMVSTASMNAGWVVAGLFALLIHSMGILFIEWVSRWRIDLSAVLYLVAGHYDDGKEFSRVTTLVVEHYLAVTTYFLSVCAAAVFLGFAIHGLIRKCRLDRTHSTFRFNNSWHYLLSDPQDDDVDCWVTVTVKHANHSCMYSGILESYAQAADGELERFALCAPIFRLELNCPPSDDDVKYCRVESDRLVIWCKDVNTLNVEYISTQTQEASDAEAIPDETKGVSTATSQ